MGIQICLHWNFFDRTNHVQMVPQEEQLSSFIELAKKICEFKNIIDRACITLCHSELGSFKLYFPFWKQCKNDCQEFLTQNFQVIHDSSNCNSISNQHAWTLLIFGKMT